MRMRIFLAACLLFTLTAGVLDAQPLDTMTLRSKIVEFAKKFLGVPYVYGSASPRGFDCTGLVYYAYSQIASFTIPRATRYLAQFGEKINQSQALPGDIYIFDTVGGPSHAGLYIGNNQVLHAASAGRNTGVIISDMSETYYATRFLYGRRILAAAAPPGSPEKNPAVQPEVPPSAPSLPLTTLDIPIGRRALRNYDRIPFLQGTLVEFELRNHRSEGEKIRVQFVRGDFEGGNYDILWEESQMLAAGEVWMSRQTKVEAEGPYTLVVFGSDGAERAMRLFRSVKE